MDVTRKAPTKSSALYRMAERMLDGRLGDRITVARADGKSYEQIARELYAEAGIEVSAFTLRSWAKQLGIEPASKEGVA